MNRLLENTETSRRCTRCKVVKPLALDSFIKDKSRPHGLGYECRECHRQRKRERGENRTDRWSLLTKEQKEKVKARQRRYNKTPKGRAISLRNAYKKIDDCDFTVEELMAVLEGPCVHCGTTDLPRGLDRIDNTKAHTKDNVAPSCAPCNLARGDRFTFEEMQEIGLAIRSVMAKRNH